MTCCSLYQFSGSGAFRKELGFTMHGAKVSTEPKVTLDAN
jgi:hypothetical protein